MSRFKGWNEAAIKDLIKIGDCINKRVKPFSDALLQLKDADIISASAGEKGTRAKCARKKTKISVRDYVGELSSALSALKVEYVREYRFLEDRRFKFDLAFPGRKVAVEFEGGIFSGGRHTRGKGYANDVKKYNLATMHGWTLLRYTTADTQEANWQFRVADEIKRFVETK